jgi:hypothetical protein
MGSTQLRTTFISLSALLGLDRLLAFLPSSFFFPFSFVAPMTAYDDLMPDSSGPADVMYNILGCRHSSLCNILQQPLEHIDDYDAGVGGQSENEHFPVAPRRDFFLQDYRTPAPAIVARLFSFYTLYYKRLGYAFCSTSRPSVQFFSISFQFRKALALPRLCYDIMTTEQ